MLIYNKNLAAKYTFDSVRFAEAVSNAGFRLFCNMDASEYWVQLRDGYMRQARRVIDGYRLEYGDEMFDDLFDVEEIIDTERPRPVPSL